MWGVACLGDDGSALNMCLEVKEGGDDWQLGAVEMREQRVRLENLQDDSGVRTLRTVQGLRPCRGQ